MTELDLELFIMDYLDNKKVKDAETLGWIAENLHSAVENAICDYESSY